MTSWGEVLRTTASADTVVSGSTKSCKPYLGGHFEEQLVDEVPHIQGGGVAHVRLQQAAHHLQEALQGVLGVGTPP